MDRDKKLLIAVPTMGNIHAELVARLLHWSRSFSDMGFYFSYIITPHDRARNQIIKHFLQHNYTHLLMIDSDTIPPFDAPEKLLAHDLPIVSAMTPIASYRDGPLHTYDNAFVDRVVNEQGEVIETKIAGRNTGLQEVKRCGASCLLIQKEVIEALHPPYFEFHYNDDLTEVERSEDVAFCDKARGAGYQIFADTGVICGHHKVVML